MQSGLAHESTKGRANILADQLLPIGVIVLSIVSIDIV